MDSVDQYLSIDNEDYQANDFFVMGKYEDPRGAYPYPSMMEEHDFLVKEENNEDTLSTVTASSNPRSQKTAGTQFNPDARVSNKTKLIQKREHAKENAKKRRQAELSRQDSKDALSVEEKIEEFESFKNNPELNNPNVDEKTKKKIMQMIRNRISAQTSRDRKKLMLSNMENEMKELRTENGSLKARIAELEAQLQAGLKHGTLCPGCAEAASGLPSHSSPFSLMGEDELRGLSRSSSRHNSPYTQNILFLVLILGCMMAFSGFLSSNGGEGGAEGFIQSPSMSQGLVPVLGPRVQGIKSSFSEYNGV